MVLLFLSSFMLALQPIVVQAQNISVDQGAPQANRPDIGAAPNGIPSIDIATPNGSGLSHNKYHDFNVDKPGVILNNLDKEVGMSDLAGVMPGNPNLNKSGSASVILNEVISGNRSALNGPTEVLGRKADVVIANPNGITCNGCGFINTSRATLSTGVPLIDFNGALSGFDVRQGDVTFGKKGANLASGKGSVDIFDVVARNVKIDGPVAGHDIGITAGAGKYAYSSREMKELYDIAGKPEYAIDGSALGALQADRIKMIGTEKGVGVRMRNDVAANTGQVTLSADGKISMNNVSGHGGVKIASRNNKVQAKQITSKKNINIKAHDGIFIATIGANGALMADSGSGLLSLANDAIIGGDLSFVSADAIKANQVSAGGKMKIQAAEAINVLVAIASDQANLYSENGDINADKGIKSGQDLNITADKGNINSGALISYNNMALNAGQDLNILGNINVQNDVTAHVQKQAKFDKLLAHNNADINANEILFDTALIGQTGSFNGNYIEGDMLIAGVDFDKSAQSPDESLYLKANGNLNLKATDNINTGHLLSSGNITALAQNDVYYDQLNSYGSANLKSENGEVSYTNETTAGGDINLTSKALDLSNNRANLKAAGTLGLTAKNIDLSSSQLVNGGFNINAADSLNTTHSGLIAVTNNGGSGDIELSAPHLNIDETSRVLAQNNLFYAGLALENFGQIAAGHNLDLKAKDSLTNHNTGLIYIGNDGRILSDGAILNDFGAITAQGNLTFADYAGNDKAASLINTAGLLQAGGDIYIKATDFTNEADKAPTLVNRKADHAETPYYFDKPEYYDELGRYRSDLGNSLACANGTSNCGAGNWKRKRPKWYKKKKKKYSLGSALYDSKDDAFSSITLPDGQTFHADNWVNAHHPWGSVELWDLNKNANMKVSRDREHFTDVPTVKGRVHAGQNMVIETDTLNNKFSDIEAGQNVNIKAITITNTGLTRNQYDYLVCDASSTCYGYNKDGSRDTSKDIARGQAGEDKVTTLETLSATIKAAADLNIDAKNFNNSAADGAVTGSAKFAAETSKDDPLKALKGMTAGGALFKTQIDLSSEQTDNQNLTPPKINSGGFGGTLPNQNFIYETRADFLDVGKFYGSAYFINRIGYKPDRTILFLGDAYFENELIDQQLRDLIGQGFGKGSFIAGQDSIDQMKTLLDKGADYSAKYGLEFGKPLSKEQQASLKETMVIYVKQTINGREVYAPVVYVAAKDKQNTKASGAVIQGDTVNITSDNITNSGLIASNNNLHINASDIVGKGGSFAAGNDVLLAASHDIDLSAASKNLNGNVAVTPTQAIESGNRAVLSASNDVSLAGVDAKANESLGISGNNVNIGSYKTKAANGNAIVAGSNLQANKDLQIKAKQDTNITGSKVAAGDRLALQADKGTLNIQSEAAKTQDAGATTTIQHETSIKSGSDMALTANKDIIIAGSDVAAGKGLQIDAGDNAAIISTQNEQNGNYSKLTTNKTGRRGSSVSAGDNMNVDTGKDILIGASNLDAKKDANLQAGGDINVTAVANHENAHSASRDYKMNMNSETNIGSSIHTGGDFTAIAGQDGKAHDLNITGSDIAADGKTGLKASNDIHIASAKDSYHLDTKETSRSGGVLGKKKTTKTNIDANASLGSSVSGADGVMILSNNDTTIAGSDIIADNKDKKADTNINTGGSLIVSSEKDTINQSRNSKTKGLLSKSSKNQNSYDEYNNNANIVSSGNTNLQAKDNIAVAGSNIFANDDVNMQGGAVSIISTQEDHNAHSQSKKSGFGIGSGGGFVSIYGKEGKTKNETTTNNIASNINTGHNVNINAKDTDANIIGSDVSADNDLNIKAKRDINVTPGQETHSEDEKKTKSGIGWNFSHSNTGVSVGAGYNKTKDAKSQDATTNAKSGLNAGNDINMNASHDANLQAADISAKRDVNVNTANDVNLLSANDETNYQEQHEKLFAGITATVDSGALQAVDSARKTVNNIKGAFKGDNKGLNGALAVFNGVDVAENGKQSYNDTKYLITGDKPYTGLGNAKEHPDANKDNVPDSLWGRLTAPEENTYNTNDAAHSIINKHDVIGGSLSVGFNKSKSEQEQHSSTPVTTTIDAGRSANIAADKGDINSQGGQVIAGTEQSWKDQNDTKAGNINLAAGDNINLSSATGTQTNNSKNSSSGASLGIDMTGLPTGNDYYANGKSNGTQTINTNTHVIGTGDVTTTSGKDSNFKGATVSGQSVTTNVGHDLNIESQQDTANSHVRNSSANLGFNSSKDFTNGTFSGGYQKTKADSDYANVSEQSGIIAGEGGYNITVNNNTDLKGGIIDSKAEKDKNHLTTDTLTSSDIQNHAEANAKATGAVLPSGVIPTQGHEMGKYDIGKTVLGNVMDSANKHKAYSSTTHSAISDGNINITDNDKQHELTGKTAEETSANINHDTEHANQQVKQIDADKLAKDVEATQALKQELFNQLNEKSNDAFLTMFVKDAPLYFPERDANGNPVLDKDGHAVVREITGEEKIHLLSTADGRRQIATNGIFSTKDGAVKTLTQIFNENHNPDDPFYLQYHPEADTAVGEMMVAAYEKVFDNTFFGLDKSSQAMREYGKLYGQSGLDMYGHSRGSMTIDNAMAALINDGYQNVLSNTTVNYYGAAANAKRSADKLSVLSGGKPRYINTEIQQWDPVARAIGLNGSTFNASAEQKRKTWAPYEWLNVLGDFKGISAHSCYGAGGPICGHNYGKPISIQVFSNNAKKGKINAKTH